MCLWCVPSVDVFNNDSLRLLAGEGRAGVNKLVLLAEMHECGANIRAEINKNMKVPRWYTE